MAAQANTSDSVKHKSHQIVFGTAGDHRKQPWRDHWVPRQKGESGDRLSGYVKGQDILLGGSGAGTIGGPNNKIMYDTKNQA